MTEDERQLAALLKEAVPQPPRPVSFDDIARQADQLKPATSRRLHGWMPALIAACVLLVVAAGGIWIVRAQTGSPAAKTTAAASSGRRSTPTASASPNRASSEVVGPWSAKALTDLPIASTIASSSDAVYAREAGQIVRLDPGTGAVSAHTALDPDAVWPPLVTTNALWQVIVANGAVAVQSLDPDTLQPGATHIITGAITPTQSGPQWTPQLAASADGSTLFLGNGDQLYALDPATGHLEQQVQVDGLIGAVAVSTDGARLDVGTNPQGSNTAELLALDPQHALATVSHTTLQGGNLTALLATSGGLWATFSGGHADSVRYLPSTDPSHSQIVSAGGGGSPSTVTLAGGVVWLGGPNTVACADPASGVVRDQQAVKDQPSQPSYFGGIGMPGGHWIAVYQTNSNAGLATFTPPSQCS